jgi:L-lactate dehydrogenase complex protein LldE
MPRVSLFIPCAVECSAGPGRRSNRPAAGRLGFDLDFHEEQTCCGQPSNYRRHLDLARESARRFIRIFEEDEVIVSPSGSCVSTIRHEYPRFAGR